MIGWQEKRLLFDFRRIKPLKLNILINRLNKNRLLYRRITVKRILWTIIITITGILIITLHINLTFGENSNSQQYPIICKNELGPYPKNVSVKKVDVNSDGLIDLIAEFSWGGSALYINCGHEKYYRAILGYGKMETEKAKTNNWVDIYNSGYIGLVDGEIYQRYFLPFNFKNSEQIIPEDFNFKHDGYSYKPQFSYSKGLRVYAPRYRFDPKIQVMETIKEQVIDKIYLELTTSSNYQISRDDQGLFCFGVLYFVDLNKDGALDAVLRYTEKAGVDAQAFAGLLLNCGDNSFIFSAEIELGSASIDNYEGIKSQTITIDGKQYTAIVFDGPRFRYETKRTVPKNAVELYIYQEKFKQFIHVTALPGKDKLTFIPLDWGFFEEEIANPLLFRNHPIELTEVDEGAIITLIGNYEQP